MKYAQKKNPETRSFLVAMTFASSALFALSLMGNEEGANRKPSAASNESITFEDIHYCEASLKGATPNQSVDPAKLPDDGSLWRVGSNRWSEAYEQKYAEWFRKHVDTEFLVRFGLKADCADTAATIRAVFSRIYHLPYLLKAGAGSKGIGHFSTDFARLPTSKRWNESEWQQALKEDQRFRALLSHIMNVASAQSFWVNSYPILAYDPANQNRLSRFVRPGTIHNRASHVKIISEVDSTQWFPIHQLSATTPASVQALSEYDDIEMGPPEGPNRGIVAWKWVVHCGSKGWQHVAADQMPGYSTQQFEFTTNPPPGLQQYESPGAYYERIGRARALKSPTRETLKRLISQLGTYLRNRVPKTFSVQELLTKTNGRIASDRNFDENYSTESFDKMVEARFANIEALVKQYGGNIPITWNEFITEAMKEEVDLREMGKTNLYFFVVMKRYMGISFDPRDSFDKRWGLSHFSSIKGYLSHELAVVPGMKAATAERLRQNQNTLEDLKRQSNSAAARPYYQWISYDRAQLADLATREELARSGLDALKRLRR